MRPERKLRLILGFAELGEMAEDTTLMEEKKSEDDRIKEVVQIFMKSLDKPEKISVEDAANIAALKMQVCAGR